MSPVTANNFFKDGLTIFPHQSQLFCRLLLRSAYVLSSLDNNMVILFVSILKSSLKYTWIFAADMKIKQTFSRQKHIGGILSVKKYLTLKAPIMTAADDKFFNIFLNFWKK